MACGTVAAAPVLAQAQGGDGALVVLDALPSKFVASRKVVVWLPPGYDGVSRRYSVVYMHDGQNLFDSAKGGQAWQVHQVLASLIASGATQPAILVGIWSSRDRAREYGPAAAVEKLAPELRASLLGDPPVPGGLPALSDQYLRFLVEELKPAIDSRFRTLKERAYTFTLGASMGAVIALYATVRHPEVFGGAACLSTHWPITTNFNLLRDPDDMRPVRIASAWFDWLGNALPRAGLLKLYFDHGDATLDALYGPYQQQMDGILRAKGYRQGIDLLSRVFPGADHSDAAWRSRVDLPLRFLLPVSVAL
ncbi:alpha/beta hydrolase-fold protein [Pseudoduganella ginsengisoli]